MWLKCGYGRETHMKDSIHHMKASHKIARNSAVFSMHSPWKFKEPVEISLSLLFPRLVLQAPFLTRWGPLGFLQKRPSSWWHSYSEGSGSLSFFRRAAVVWAGGRELQRDQKHSRVNWYITIPHHHKGRAMSESISFLHTCFAIEPLTLRTKVKAIDTKNRRATAMRSYSAILFFLFSWSQEIGMCLSPQCLRAVITVDR